MKWFTALMSSFQRRHSAYLLPESQFVVEFDESTVSLSHPKRTKETIAWADVDEVLITTNDEGPWVCDWSWLLRVGNGGLVVSKGATGEDRFFERLQKLPAFDNAAVQATTRRTDNFQISCWRR